MNPDKTLMSGSTSMLLLKLLSEKDMYGYEMIETLRERSQNVFELKAGTLYPLLHGMEQKKLLTAYEKSAGGKMRKYYSITKQGKKALSERRASGARIPERCRMCWEVFSQRWEEAYENGRVHPDADGTDSL